VRIVFAAAAALLVLTMPPTARSQTAGETVRLLVPLQAPTGPLQTQTAASPDIGWKRIVVPVDGTVEDTVRGLERDLGTTVMVERSFPVLGGEKEPLFSDQWGLENTGQHGGRRDADIGARPAWSIATGNGVVVAVVDSGVDASHPELDEQMWVNPGDPVNGGDDDGNGFPDDRFGWDFVYDDNDPSPEGTGLVDAHGTFIAGIIAAEVDGSGVAGVAPDARIMNVRACDDGNCWELDAAEAIVYAVDNGADIINLSFGRVVPEDVFSPVTDAIEHARRNDVLVVTAAGNNSPELVPNGFIMFPAETPHSNNLAVAATNRDDRMANFSYYGPNIDIAAPGVDILGPTLVSYAFLEGTSFAAPHVAGAAALLLSDSPGASHHELAARLEAWVDTPGDVGAKVESGRLNAGDVLIHRFVDTLGHTFKGDTEWAADQRVTKGCNPPENTLFCPDESVTRGQMAAFLRRHLRLPAASRDHFRDDNGSTFENDINRLAEAGITKGCNPPANDRFCPDDSVTRDQMAAFIVRALGLTDEDHPGFDDVTPSNIFFRDIERLATADITRGCNPPDNNLYCPKASVTRGQMTAFLHRSG